MACYYIVISSTHLSNGHFRNIKGVFRGPLGKNGSRNLDYAEKEKTMVRALEDLKANFYCALCDKQYYKHQQFDNHINSYDHAHKQRLKELKQREFARNVASKSRRDEKKQERALRRLHQLAEQRREVKCAPGSGPMFKSTTVAVEGSFQDACCGNVGGASPATAPDAGAQNDISSPCLASNSKHSPSSNTSSTKKLLYGQKIAFSFSFPKKASIKLESSAAVFCENAEEGSAEHGCRQRLRASSAEVSLPSSPTAEKSLNYNEAIYSTGTQWTRDKLTHRSHQAESCGSAEIRDMDQDSQAPASDLCALLVNSEDMAAHCISKLPRFPICLKNADMTLYTKQSLECLKVDSARNKQESEEQAGEVPNGDNVFTEQIFQKCQKISTGASSVQVNNSGISTGEEPSQSPGKQADLAAKASCPFAKHSPPFCSVLSKDGSTVLQWPSEMLAYTRTEPRLSYSCNPLCFDFRASRCPAERASGVGGAPMTHGVSAPHTGEQACLSPASVSQGKPENNEEVPRALDHGATREEPSWLSELAETKEDHTHRAHHANCPKSFLTMRRRKKCKRRSKECAGVGKRGADKLRGRDGRDRGRSGRRNRRRNARSDRRTGSRERYADRPHKLLKEDRRWEGCDSQFRGNSSQQAESLEESIQSPQDQDQNSSGTTEGEKTGRVRQETVGGVNGADNSPTEHSTIGEIARGGNERDLNDLVGQAKATGRYSNSCISTDAERPFGIDGRGRGPSLHQRHCAKRRRGSASDEEEQSCKHRLCLKSLSLVGGYGGREEFARGGWHKGCAGSCCRQNRKRKRCRGSCHSQMLGPDTETCRAETGVPDVGAQSLFVNSKSPQLQNDLTTQSEDNKRLKGPGEALAADVNAESSVFSSLAYSLLGNALTPPVQTCTERTCSPSPGPVLAGGSRGSESAPLPAPDLSKTENMSDANKEKDTGPPHCADSEVGTPDAKGCENPQPEDSAQQHSENTSHDKLFEHGPQSQHPKSQSGFARQEVKLNRRCVRTESAGSPPHASQQAAFQHPCNGLEKHCLQQIQAHGQALHQQTFPSNLKPTLPRPPVPVPSPLLYPIPLHPPLSSTSITIQHTILQQHTAFLQHQPPLLPQVLPLTRVPLRAEICHPAPPFIPQAQPVLAPPGLHPMNMIIHTLPRPAIFSSVIPPHPAIIPLQPLL